MAPIFTVLVKPLFEDLATTSPPLSKIISQPPFPFPEAKNKEIAKTAMSSETKKPAVRSLNPWVFNLQKLGLELKCPLCMNLLTKPMLLPCNHIFCKLCVPKSEEAPAECATCQHHFTDQEIRPASHIENIILIYKSLKSTFNSTILPLLSTGAKSPIQTPVDLPQKKTPSQVEYGQTNAVQINQVNVAVELAKKPGKNELVEESDMNQAPVSSPGSSLSIDAKKDPGSATGSITNNTVTGSTGHHCGVDGKAPYEDTTDAREPKRQKKLSYGQPEAVTRGYGHSSQKTSQSDHAALSNSDEGHKGDTSVFSSMAVCDASHTDGSICAFCHSSRISEETGLMLHYLKGKAVERDEVGYSEAISVHSKCIDWAPQVYYEEDTIKNLELELARASKLKCSECRLKGAALGCLAKSCRRSYHAPCAARIPGCRWDCGDFVMLCPAHKSLKFPSEKLKSKKRNNEACFLPTQIIPEQLNSWSASNHGPQKWVFCGSALSAEEKSLLAKFAALCGATVVKSWNPGVTHVIAATNANGACSRTLKVLMAILNGKWILTMDWVKACMKACCPVNEEPYEINQDNHGCHNGPRTGRVRALDNEPKLFAGLGFFFTGAFIPAYKDDLLGLVRVGGGTIFESMEQIFTQRTEAPQVINTNLVVYNADIQCMSTETSPVSERIAEAEDVAKWICAPVVPHTWILESIAACKVLPHQP